MNEAAWKRLLTQIRDGLVVPVVGSRLLVQADGRTSRQAAIAEALLAQHGAACEPGTLPPFRELNEAFTRLKASVDPQDLYADIHELMQAEAAAHGAQAPLPLQQLADIADFRLFVSLTPDDWLKRCLARRIAVNEIVHSPKWPAAESRDLVPGWMGRAGEAHLLYLFGKARPVPTFAIHDEDQLEYAHNMVARATKVPEAFLDELKERNLLLIGCNFPDWLGRFFLRVTNKGRLSEKGKREWLVEQLAPQESLTCFLQSYSKGTEVMSTLSPVEFVAELHRRWTEGNGAANTAAASLAPTPNPKGAVFFVSYSRLGDQPRAQALVEKLRALGAGEAEVWFDRESIEPGQDFQHRILDGIQRCRYFLPLLSQFTNDREEGFVFKEWHEANQRLPGMNREFVLPVVVDDSYVPESYNAIPVRDWQRKNIDYGFAPGGLPDDRLTKRLQDLLRAARRPDGAAPP